MFNLDHITNKDDNTDWPYRKLIIFINLLNSIQKDNNIINKICLYAKDLEEPKYQFFIEKREQAGIKNDKNAFIEYSNSTDDILDNIEDFNKKRKRKASIVFDDMISHVMSNKKAQQVLKELFIGCRKLNISLILIAQCYHSVPKTARLNCTQYILFKLNNKRENYKTLQLIIQPILTIKILLKFTKTVPKNHINF